MTRTKTYSVVRVRDCRDCPAPKLTSSKTLPHMAMMCSAAPAAFVLDDADYAAGRVPAACPLATGDVMLTRDDF